MPRPYIALNAILPHSALAATLAVLTGCSGPAQAQDQADLILTNARVYTVETAHPWAEAVAIGDGTILAVGTKEEVQAFRGDNTQTVDLQGKLLMPAFGDAHVHPVFGGMSHSRCPLHDGKSVEEYQQIIRGCVADTPGDGPVYGVGWQDALFPPNGVPRKEVLDAVSADRPLVFESVGGHSYWVNSKALELAGITRDTPDPANGQIDRDPETGEPVGGLQEAAMGLVEQFVPSPDQTEIENSITYTAHLMNSLGITMMHDALVDVTADEDNKVLLAYKAVQDRGDLSLHATIALRWKNDEGLDQIPALVETSAKATEWGLNARSVKIFMDGVIPQRTAAMIQPYSNDKDNYGTLQIPPGIVEQAVAQLADHGMQAHFHAIGDRATHVALDAIEAARTVHGSANRAMISHLNVIDPADQARFGQLGAIAVFQPTWAANYPYMDLTEQAIGPERSHWIYPAGSVLKAGGMIAYGSDWPVATANPLEGIQVAATRINYQDPDSPPLLPDEAISVEDAVRAHTFNVAYALGLDDVTGSISPGKSADIIVLDRNIFDIPLMEISRAKVLTTLFKGEVVSGSLD